MQRLKLRGERSKVDQVLFCGNEGGGAGALLEPQQAIDVRLVIAVMVAEAQLAPLIVSEFPERGKKLAGPRDTTKGRHPV